MKNILCLLMLSFLSLNAQSELKVNLPLSHSLTKTSKNYGKLKGIKIDSVVTKVDSTLFNRLEDFTFFENKILLRKYKFHVFGFEDNKSIQQWVVPIKIYFDPLIDKSIIKGFENFIAPFNTIKNLDITIVNDLNDATYFFKVMEKEISAYSKKNIENYSLDERENLTFNLMTYHLNVKSNNQIYSCTFKISPEELENSLFLNKLKKGFYFSLNRFYSSSQAEKYSILNTETEILNAISDYDLAMLQIHYQYVFKTPIYLKQFKYLEEKYKSFKK
jgi:hypothetical protein